MSREITDKGLDSQYDRKDQKCNTRPGHTLHRSSRIACNVADCIADQLAGRPLGDAGFPLLNVKFHLCLPETNPGTHRPEEGILLRHVKQRVHRSSVEQLEVRGA